MSKREFDTFKEAPCPCGQGQITRHVESTDYPFTSCHVSYSLDCPNCQGEWSLDHGTLVLKSSESEYKAIQPLYESIRTKVYDLSKELVKIHFNKNPAKTKKAELEHLKNIGICNSNYSQYTKYRREGKEIHDIAYGLNNLDWLLEVAETNGMKTELNSLLNQRDELSKKADEAYKKIVRNSFK